MPRTASAGLLVAFLLVGCSGGENGAPRDAESRTVPLPVTGRTVLESDFPEPSGLVFHSGRGTLFVVGDEGDIGEWQVDGEAGRWLRRKKLGGWDFEGVTFDPATGLLYAAVEAAEEIVEIDPDELVILRRFRLPARLDGRLVLAPGGNGLEGITFVPDGEGGGTFFVTNQNFEPTAGEDPSAILKVELPLDGETTPARDPGEGDVPVLEGRLLACWELGVPDLSGLAYDGSTDRLLVISDAANAIFEVSRDGELLSGWALPGKDQEGIALDREGRLYLAQDSGGLLRWEWRRE